MLRETVALSIVLAAFVLVAAALLGNFAIGLGLAAGLVIGSFNGHLVAGLMARETPFVAGSVVRMAIGSAVAIGAAFILGSQAWAVLLGVGAAQLVMVGAGIRQGLRA